MVIGLNCFHASSAGSVFCTYCGAGLGQTLCEKGRKNPLGTGFQVCGTCRSANLVPGARGLRLGRLAPLLSAVLAIAVWKWLVAHLALAASLLGRASLATAAFLLDSSPRSVACWMQRLAAWIMIFCLFGQWLALFPGRGSKTGEFLRTLPSTVLRAALHLARIVSLSVAAALPKAFFGRPLAK